MKQRHSLGQIFLKNKKYIDGIFDCLEIEGKKVLEIGPGEGEISWYISDKAEYLHCVEIDSRFCSLLKDKFAKKTNVEIIQGNILEFPLSKLGKEIVIFGNVPYQISSHLIDYLIRYRKFISKAYLTFQKEFVQKLIAKPCSGQYQFLSCLIQYYAKVENLLDIPSEAFYPRPKVDSSFIRIEFYRNLPIIAKNEGFLFKFIRGTFLHRRKKLINTIKDSSIVNILKKGSGDLNIDINRRPAEISMENYCRIADYLFERHRGGRPCQSKADQNLK